MMNTFETVPNSTRTLAQRLAEGRIPVQEALRYSMILAEALRKIHDAGRTHGAVTPSNVALTGAGLELIPALAPPVTATAYTAPEVLQGRPADSRSDIFSYGAVIYEMLTGKRAFEGEGASALAASLTSSAPPPSGSPAFDRLVASCVAKDPSARCQRMQKVIMELKLLTVSARRADAPAARPQQDLALRADMQQLEARVVTRFQSCEKTVADLQRAASEALNAVRAQVASMAADLAAVQERNAQAGQSLEAVSQHILAQIEPIVDTVGQRVTRVEQSVETVGLRFTKAEQGLEAAGKQVAAVEQSLKTTGQRVAVVEQSTEAAGQRVARVEQSIDALSRNTNTLQSNVAADLHQFEQTLKVQATAIESARTAMAQTDDLVERVVEALELLQSSVLDQSAERLASTN